jgi:ubiquitin-protein ligase
MLQCVENMKNAIKNHPSIDFLSYNNSTSYVVIYLNVKNKKVTITTDFNNYCNIESSEIDFTTLNIHLVFKLKTPIIIINEVSKFINETTLPDIKDTFHIFNTINEFCKYTIDYTKLLNELNKVKNTNDKFSTIPKQLLLTQQQYNTILINEIKNININKDYLHYIIPDETNPYNLYVRIFFDNPLIKAKKDFDYMEIKLIIHPYMYPFYPPKLEYIKPKIKLELLLSLLNLNILKLENWNPAISLEYLITNLANELNNTIYDYIELSDKTNTYNNLEYQKIKLLNICGIYKYDKININIPNISYNKSTNTHWKAGTGYSSSSSSSNWDIKIYIKEQELQKEELYNCLVSITNILEHSDILDLVIFDCLLSQIKGINMLELEKNKELYLCIFNILYLYISKDDSYITNVFVILKNLYDEYNIIKDNINDDIMIQIYTIIDILLSKYIYTNNIEDITINDDIKENYCLIMKKLQFDIFELPNTHLYYEYISSIVEQKSLLRILSEISSLKTNLPLNWDSTIWIRISKQFSNIFTFIISGPKNTPYENGLFEFHVFLPSNYPNSPPKVLLNTTGNKKFRFNPNLYQCGKTCLSLLGTWESNDSEKWNPKTSTFLQVIVSIQSLILIDDPYFNEPSYEKKINTDVGKRDSKEYNEKIYPRTIEYAMIDMIQNPPIGFEQVVKEHFKLKKNEIINTTNKWNSNNSSNTDIKLMTDKLIPLLNTL